MQFMTDLDTQNAEEAMEAANHNFEVKKMDTQIAGTSITIPDKVAVVNADTMQYLGTVGRTWEPVQPKTLYDLAAELIQSTDGKINGAFNMHGGSVIGISFELTQREYVAGDPTLLNFVMLIAFDGSHGIAGHSTTHRLSCMNQCNTSNKIYNLKHTKNVHNRLEVVRNMIRYYNNEIQKFDAKMTHMVESRMNTNAAIEWFKSLFPEPSSERAQTILSNQVSVFTDCLHNGRGSDIQGVRGTCYGAFQALTEYINYYRSVKIHNDREEDEVRFQSIHFGSGNTLTQKGLKSITAGFSEFSEDEFLIQ